MPTEISGSTGVNKIQDGTVVNADINSSAAIAGSKLVMPTGSVLQVVTAVKTDRVTFGSTTSWQDTGLSVSITPISSSSKILISADLTLGSAAGGGYGVGVRCLRGSTLVVGADAQTGRLLAHSLACHGSNVNDCSTTHLQHIDSPNTTSSTTYKIQGNARDQAAWTLNQAYTNNDATTNYRANGISSIVLMEIAG